MMRVFYKIKVYLFFFLSLFPLFLSFAYAGNTKWQLFNKGFTGSEISVVTASPESNGKVFAATEYGGLYVSDDHAKSWVKVNGFDGAYVWSLVFNPFNAKQIYAGTYQHGLLKSIDEGKTWKKVETFPGNNYVRVAFNPSNPQELIASSGKLVYQSMDNGLTWKKVLEVSDQDSTFIDAIVSTIEVNPNNPKMILVGTHWGSTVYQSMDDGRTWSSLKNDQTYHIDQIAFVPGMSSRSYISTSSSEDGGLYQSDDDAKTWKNLLFLNKNGETSFIINKNNINELFFSKKQSGLYKSINGSKTWRPVNGNFDSTSVGMIAANPKNSNELFLVESKKGLLRSQDDGVSWEEAGKGLLSIDVTSLAIDPQHPKKMYAGTMKKGLWMTEDGETWLPSDDIFREYPIYHIQIDPVHSDNVILITGKDNSLDRTIYRSTDGGKTWQKRGKDINLLDWGQSFVINPSNPNEMFAGYDALLKSNDNGVTWSVLASSQAIKIMSISSIVINPYNANEIYVGGLSENGRCVSKSVDGGKTWTLLPFQFGMPYSRVHSISMDPVDTKKLYAVVEDQAIPTIYKTENGGSTWTVIGDTLPTSSIEHSSIGKVMIDPNHPNILYVPVGFNPVYYYDRKGEGVYVSKDGGNHWSPFNDGLDNLEVRQLNLDHGKLFATTSGSGIFVTDAVSG